MQADFLPLTKVEMAQRGWSEVDIVLVSGDAYIDHPAFGTAVIGRVLEHHGYRVAIIAMPDWKDAQSITVFGKPRLFFGVSAGNVDSMLAKYTAFKRYRSDDPYVPGGKSGARPERALIVYCNLIKSVYKDVPIVIGGIEASMRRIAHYDFWSDTVRRSIIEDCRATILVYGMGEKPILDIAERLASARTLEGIPGTVIISKEAPENAAFLPREEDVLQSKEKFIECYRQFYRQQHVILAQPTAKRFLIHYPPADITSEELDAIYELPFTRKPHPSYRETIPAYRMIKDSITSHRGCVGGCSFCSLTLHQGKRIVSRSEKSIFMEVALMTHDPTFKGHVRDIGGPSANMYGFECTRHWRCTRESCTFPARCLNLQLRGWRWVKLLQQVAKIAGVRKVTIGSGIRYDLLMIDREPSTLLQTISAAHISGQLKIAPEAISPVVLKAMRKIPLFDLQAFVEIFQNLTINKRKRQHLLPYFMSCHPGTTKDNMKEMKKEIYAIFKFMPEQVQAFIPLPMTLSAAIFYTGVDPLTGEKFFVMRDLNDRKRLHQNFLNS